MTTIVWFRQDLRVRDNPALAAAAAKGGVVPIFILEDSTSASHRRLGRASRWWFRVYTPYWRASLAKPVAAPLQVPKLKIDKSSPLGDRLEEWELLPTRPNWAAGWEKIWRPGESSALARLDEFANDHLCRYSELRDRPDLQGTSRLSPHLHWGEISPRQIWGPA